MSLRTTTMLLAVGLFCAVNASNAQAFDLLDRFVNLGSSQKSKGCVGCGHTQKSGAKQKGATQKCAPRKGVSQKGATQKDCGCKRASLWNRGGCAQKGATQKGAPQKAAQKATQKGGKGYRSWFAGLNLGGSCQKGDCGPSQKGARQKGCVQKGGSKQK